MANNVNTNLDPAITIKKPNVIDPSTIATSTTVNINIDPQLNSAKKHSVIVQPTSINKNTTVNTPPIISPVNNVTLNESVIEIVKNYLDTYHGVIGSSSHANIADFANAVTYSSILGRPTFSTVAFTGDYNSLNNIPGVANYATFSYVDSAVSNLVNSAPAALNTLNELANAIANDASFSTTISSALGNRLRFDIGTQNLNNSQKANAITNLGLATVANTGSYNDLTNKPTLFSGSYADLTNKPTPFSGSYADLSNKPTLNTFLPTQSSNSGKYLTTDGTVASWSTITGGGAVNTGNWAFSNDTIYNFAGGSINNSDLSHGATAGLALPDNGNSGAITGLFNNYGNVVLASGEIITTDLYIGGNGSEFYTDVNINGTIIDGWRQRNPQQIEINIFADAAPIWATLIGASLGATVIVTYSTPSGNQTFTSVLSQQFTGQGQYHPVHGSAQRYSGRIDGTLPTDQTGIVTINFPTSSFTNSNWVFGQNGNLTLPTNTFNVNYANGTQVSLGGNYGDSNVTSLMNAFDGNPISNVGSIQFNGGTKYIYMDTSTSGAQLGMYWNEAQGITLGENGINLTTYTGTASDYNHWTLGTDGNLSLPGGGSVYNIGAGTAGITANITSGNAYLGLDDTDSTATLFGNAGVQIGTNVSVAWNFSASGNLTLPAGGDILDSTGNSALGQTFNQNLNTSNNVTFNSVVTSNLHANIGSSLIVQSGNGTPIPSGIVFNGALSGGGYMVVPSSPAWATLGTVWTIEFRIKPTSSSASKLYRVMNQEAESGKTHMDITISDGKLTITGTSSNPTYYTEPTVNVWTHVAIVNNNTQGYVDLYYDGVLQTNPTGYGGPSNFTSTNPIYIGKIAGTGDFQYFPGILSAIRISTVVRYTHDFTPPTEILVSDSDTLLLMNVLPGAEYDDSSSYARTGITHTNTTIGTIPGIGSQPGSVVVSANSHDWTFDSDGILTLPDFGSTFLGNGYLQSGTSGTNVGIKSWNTRQKVFVNDTNVTIQTIDNSTVVNNWAFDTTGNLTLPANGTINDSTGKNILRTEPSFEAKYSDFNALSGHRYGVDTTSVAVNATLPDNPDIGDAIYFMDFGYTFATNNLTVLRGGTPLKTIMNQTSDLVVSTIGQSFGLVWTGTTWRVY